MGSNTMPSGVSPSVDDWSKFLVMDSSNPREFYLLGKFRYTSTSLPITHKQSAMVLKVNKLTGKLVYQSTFGVIQGISGSNT